MEDDASVVVERGVLPLSAQSAFSAIPTERFAPRQLTYFNNAKKVGSVGPTSFFVFIRLLPCDELLFRNKTILHMTDCFMLKIRLTIKFIETTENTLKVEVSKFTKRYISLSVPQL